MLYVQKGLSPWGREHKLFPARHSHGPRLWSPCPGPHVDASHACASLCHPKAQGDPLQISGAPSSLAFSSISSGCLEVQLWAVSPSLAGACGLETPQAANRGKGRALLIHFPSQVRSPMLLAAQCLKTVASCILSDCLRQGDKSKCSYSILTGSRIPLLPAFGY